MGDLSVDVASLRSLAAGLRGGVAALDSALNGLSGAATAQLGTPELDEACQQFHQKWQRGLTLLRQNVDRVGTGLDATALTPIAGPIALISGGIALGAHAMDIKAHDKWGQPGAWVTLGGDALGMVPGVGALTKGAATDIDILHGADSVMYAGSAAREVTGMAITHGINDAGMVNTVGQGGAAASNVFASLGRTVAEKVGGDPVVVGKVLQVGGSQLWRGVREERRGRWRSRCQRRPDQRQVGGGMAWRRGPR